MARAVAVLGESADLPTVAALAELSEKEVAAQTAALARAEILRDEPPLGFVHPLVRDAVYHELPPAKRELMHSHAAEALRDTGAPADQVAAHLLSMPRRGEEWVANVLIQAAHAASRRSAPESAVTYLTRALEEPPPSEWRAEVLLELGLAGTNTFGPAAIDHLREAYDLLDDPRRRALAAFVLARTLMFAADPDAAAAFAHRAADELPEECSDERQALVAVELSSTHFNARVEDATERFLALRDDRFGDGPGARMLAAATAFDLMTQGRSRERAVELALHSVEDRSLFEADNGLFWMAATLALANADHPEIPALWAETLAHAHRNGSLFSQLSMSLWDGAFKLAQGELAEAEESLRANLVEAELYGLRVEQAMSYTYGFLGGALLEAGDLDGRPGGDRGSGRGRRRPVRRQRTSSAARSWASTWPRATARARWRRPRTSSAMPGRPATRHGSPWRSLKAQALAMLGRRDEAIELAREEVELAREWGAPTGLGRVAAGARRAARQGRHGRARAGRRAARGLEPADRAGAGARGARRGAAPGAAPHRRARAAAARARDLRDRGREGARGARALRALRDGRAAAHDRSRGRGVAHRARAARGHARGRRPDQPRHRPDPVRDAQDGRGPPLERLPEAEHRLTARAARGPRAGTP